MSKRKLLLVGFGLVLVLALTQGSLPYLGLARDAQSTGAGSHRALVPPSKMHFPQQPDLGPTGLDVDMSVLALADDFLCTQSGPIELITIWGSFFADMLPPGGPESLTFYVSIHANIPVGVEQRWSMPGELLWSQVFEPGQYLVDIVADDLPEGWYDPLQEYWEAENHSLAFRFDFPVEREPFRQEEGTIYWLQVAERRPPQAEYMFGWKTTTPELRWEDDAVYTLDPPDWHPLAYPPRHPLEGETLDLAFVIAGGPGAWEFGDAPEGPAQIAYPSTGTVGSFPTCRTAGPAEWIQHGNFGAFFGPAFDLEVDGNAGSCPPPGCFPPYDQDECFADGDAGLLIPSAFTIDPSLNVIPCRHADGLPLGGACDVAVWGATIDIDVHNLMPGQAVGYVNVLIDWDQDGRWSSSSACPGPSAAPEHVLVNFPVPNGFEGPLSVLSPLPFQIGPNPGFVWARFSITEQPVPEDWHGDGSFEDGETEDYLLAVESPEEPTPTQTATATETPTYTPTQTATTSPTLTATATGTRPPSPTASPTSTGTATRVPSTATPTETGTPRATATTTPTTPPGHRLYLPLVLRRAPMS